MFTNREKMKKFEALTLEEAYELAKKELNCTMLQMEYEVVQYPSSGFFGIGRKKAIILAGLKNNKKSKVSMDEIKSKHIETKTTQPDFCESDDFANQNDIKENAIHEFTHSVCKEMNYSESKCNETVISPLANNELTRIIENEIFDLFSKSCYNVDVVEVDIVDSNALIFIDGDDVAILIGKDGYRYNAISYMLFSWLYAKYELFVKLEIASFVTSQEDMIGNILLPVIDKINSDGKGRTRPLKGILVQIALKQLRDSFPTKYVAIKTNKNGDRYILVNDFNKKPNE